MHVDRNSSELTALPVHLAVEESGCVCAQTQEGGFSSRTVVALGDILLNCTE